jgi:LPS sulfotransferase NodH
MKIYSTLKKFYGRLLSARERITNRIFGYLEYRKFVIISDARTGSTLLMALLDNHPEIIAKGELFKQLLDRTTPDIWKDLFRKRSKKIKWVGFKLFYDHPWNSGERKVWDLIEQDKNIVIIQLVRHNKVRSYVSKQIGLKTKLWTEGINKPNTLTLEDKKVNIDPRKCIENIEEIDRLEFQTKERFRDHKIIPMIYEELSADKNKAMNRIYKDLNVTVMEIQTNLKKQNPEKLQDLVLNYEELRNYLSNTRWDFCLEEKAVGLETKS